jgi:predicted extracellular nuclease
MRAPRLFVLISSVLWFVLAGGCSSSPDQQPAVTTKPAGVSTPATVAAPAAAPASIRVGAWNIEWLGSPERRSGPAENHAQTSTALAKYILESRVDILGLAEVAQDVEDRPGTNATLTAALRLVEQQTGGKWQHRLFPARSGRNQCCGIAWDTTRVTLLGEPCPITQPERTSLQSKPLWSRPPYGLTFSAGEGLTDFVVVVIHMKSDYGGDFSHHRAEEAVHLTLDLPGVIQDGDVIIIGDANCGTHMEPAVAAIEAGGFIDLNADDTPTHWTYGALDRAFVPADQPEFADRYFEVFGDSFINAHGLSIEQFKVDYSDHFMVITQVTVLPDDD